MKLTEDQIKQGLLHPQQIVRDVALRYFSEAFSADPTVMPLAIQAIEAYGWDDAFRFAYPVGELAQTGETLRWLIDQLNRVGRPKAHADIERCGRLSSMIAKADVSVLLEHEEKVLGLENLDPDAAEAISERLRLLTVDTEACWKELYQFCEDSRSKQDTSGVGLPHAHRLVEAIARDEHSADRVLSLLSQRVENLDDTPMAWVEPFAVRAAGLMGQEAAVPLLIDKLIEDPDDLVNEECQSAFRRIGTPATVAALARAFPAAPWHFQLYASSALGGIHTDSIVPACLSLLEVEEKGEMVRANLVGAILGNFASEGIEPARDLSHHGNREVQRTLVGAATLMNISFPELEQWRAEEQKRDEEGKRRMREWFAPLPAGPKAKAPPGKARLASPAHAPPAPIVGGSKAGRNDPCPCGSGKKYKKCCMEKDGR